MNMLKQRIKTKKNITIKKLNDYFDKMIDKSKSCEDQIESLKKVENLNQYCSINDFDAKELKSFKSSKYFEIFKIKLADMSNDIDEKLSEQIFGYTLEKLANKLINPTNKEEKQIIVKNTNANKKKSSQTRKNVPLSLCDPIRLSKYYLKIKAIKFILDFNESELKGLV